MFLENTEHQSPKVPRRRPVGHENHHPFVALFAGTCMDDSVTNLHGVAIGKRRGALIGLHHIPWGLDLELGMVILKATKGIFPFDV